jgi:uncharacterized membrane protein
MLNLLLVLIIAILVLTPLAVLILWARTGSLEARARRAEMDLRALERELEVVRATARGAFEVGPSVVPVAPSAAPAPSGELESEVKPEPEPVPWHPEPVASGVRAYRRTAQRGIPTVRAEFRDEPLPAPVTPEPEGPGIVRATLKRLGLTPPEGAEALSRGAIEAWLEGRMLAVVGGIALVLGAVFFLSLAFSRGWITEPMRVLIGLAAGGGLLILGEAAFEKVRGILGHVLVAVGLAVVSLSLFAATRLYDLVPVELALVGAFVSAIVAAAIAVRHDSQLVAGFGLIAVLAAPPVLGAEATLVTLLFVAAALIGTTAIALFRTWVWLPPLAFVLAAPQVASYVLGDATAMVALVVLTGFWLVNLVAAGGEEIRNPTDRLRPSTLTLLLASAAFTLWGAFVVLHGPDETWRGAFVAGLGGAYLALGLLFLARGGDRHPFGLAVAATGVAAVTMAVPIQFGGPPVPIAWAAEAAALAWVATQRRHPYSAVVALVLGALALSHLVVIEYPIRQLMSGFDRTWPFVGPEGMACLFVLGAMAAAAAAVPIAWVRGSLAIVGGIVALYVMAFELSGPALVVAWAALTVGAAAGYRFLVAPSIPAGFVETRVATLRLPAAIEPTIGALVADLSRVIRPLFAWATGLPVLAMIGHILAFDFPITRVGEGPISEVPFVGPETIAVVAVLVALAVAGWLARDSSLRLGVVGIGLMLLSWSAWSEVALPWVMVPWAVIALAGIAVARRIARVELVPRPSTLTIAVIAARLPFAASAFTVLLLLVESNAYASVGRFVAAVTGEIVLTGTPFLDARTFAVLVLAATFGAAGWIWGTRSALVAGAVAAAAAVAWVLPYEIRPAYAVAGWSLLALLGAWVIRRWPEERTRVGVAMAGLVGVAVTIAVIVVAPPTRLAVDASTVVAGWPWLTDASVATGALAVAVALGAWLLRADPLSRIALLGAGVVALYGVSVGLVDVFQQQVGDRPLGDLEKEAQVGLSVLWALLGGAGFAVGLRTHLATIRQAGLALLGLATVKVFLVDLAALDVAYRVLSLVALGVLLLLSAFVHAQSQRPHPPTGRHA